MSTDVEQFTGADDVTVGGDPAALERRLKSLNGEATTIVSTLPDAEFTDKVRNMSILTNSLPLVDQGEGFVIALKHVIVQTIEMDGKDVPRVILVDESGQGYHAISAPILGSIESLFGLVKNPNTYPGGEWPAAIPTRLVKVRAPKGTAFTLSFGE